MFRSVPLPASMPKDQNRQEFAYLFKLSRALQEQQQQQQQQWDRSGRMGHFWLTIRSVDLTPSFPTSTTPWTFRPSTLASGVDPKWHNLHPSTPPLLLLFLEEEEVKIFGDDGGGAFADEWNREEEEGEEEEEFDIYFDNDAYDMCCV